MDYLSLCLICKDENDYLPEWLDYHILMGVDRFYIYDNESQISLRQSLREYIERGWVMVVEIQGKAVQLHAYDHCLRTFGANTFWLGFIDTDEFLVPKTGQDLKELLKDYEAYGGLAVNSLFFGSNGHQNRPAAGQIASYTQRTHLTFKENELIKSIIQPGLALMPYSPHELTYKENFWCVNEGFLRVDNQVFPNHIEKIQLNHYFCRSRHEQELKLRRGRGAMNAAWPRKRFEVVNHLATIQDTIILQIIEAFFNKAELDRNYFGSTLLENMAVLARLRCPTPMKFSQTADVTFRKEVVTLIDVETQFYAVKERGDHKEIKEWILKKLQVSPQRFILNIDLAICCLNLKDPSSAWQALTQAWQFAPNSYSVLFGMTYYFLRVKNFMMAEKTCHLLLEMAPHDLTVLGFMTEAMIGEGRYEEAIAVGVPVVELGGQLGELPEQMGVFLVKKMADYLLEKKDHAGAVRLWEAGLKCQPDDVNVLIELAQALLLAGEIIRARQYLIEVQSLSPQNATVLSLLSPNGPFGELIGTLPAPSG
jgi:Tfp pilus assembly protein PilF